MKEESTAENSEPIESQALINEAKKDPELASVLNKVPQAIQIKLAATIGNAVTRVYVGPIPHPDILKEYDKINPGFAKAMLGQHLSLQSTQTAHRIEMEKKSTDAIIDNTKRGLNYALVYAALVLLSGVAVSFFNPICGASIIGGSLLVGLGLFITRRYQEPG